MKKISIIIASALLFLFLSGCASQGSSGNLIDTSGDAPAFFYGGSYEMYVNDLEVLGDNLVKIKCKKYGRDSGNFTDYQCIISWNSLLITTLIDGDGQLVKYKDVEDYIRAKYSRYVY